MYATVLVMEPPTTDTKWLAAARRECIAYGEHGQETEVAEDGKKYCVNCRGLL